MTVRSDSMKPADIESRSFAIIAEILAEKGQQLDPVNASVIMRCIHTSADFDYVENLFFSQQAVLRLQEALRAGCVVVTDTQMARAGINKKAAALHGIDVECFMADEDVAMEAKERAVTRALVSMEKAMRLERPVIFAVGNAPTALLRLYEAITKEGFSPAGIIAVPVGFVNVVESKEHIVTCPVPCIVARGRKGGSNIAAAICNALIYDL